VSKVTDPPRSILMLPRKYAAELLPTGMAQARWKRRSKPG
jgi:hypothetical protein